MSAGWEWDESLFAGTARHYRRGRLPYAPGFAAVIAAELRLDGSGRLLDIGCGPGTVTLPLAPYFEQVVGLDPDPGMLAEAAAAGAGNARWVRARAEDLPGGLGSFRVVTFAQSFHWTDRARVAATVRDLLQPGGWIVHVANGQHAPFPAPSPLPPAGPSSPSGALPASPPSPASPPASSPSPASPPLRSPASSPASSPLRSPDSASPASSPASPGSAAPARPAPPYEQIGALVRRYLGPVRRAGRGIIAGGRTPGREDLVIAAAGFVDHRRLTVPAGQVVERGVDDLVAWTLSLSSSAPHLFGDRLADFERELRALLRDAGGVFAENLPPTDLQIWRRPAR